MISKRKGIMPMMAIVVIHSLDFAVWLGKVRKSKSLEHHNRPVDAYNMRTGLVSDSDFLKSMKG